MARFPFPPHPRGWYALGPSQSLPSGAVRAVHRFGRDLAMFRTERGAPAVVDARCPHLGAHLGDGRVRGELLICPFHHFGYGVDGVIASLPEGYGPKLPRLSTPCWAVREVDGFVLVWFDERGAPPDWEPPARDATGFRPMRSQRWRLRTHPQETGEGSVDIGHLRTVHRYLEVEEVAPIRLDGPRLRTHFRITRRSGAGMAGETFSMDVTPELHGLGYSVVDVLLPRFDLAYRVWVLATPMDDEHIDYQVALRMREPARPGRLHPALALLPRALAARLIEEITFRAFVHDVELDFPIWERKAYVHPPGLTAGDGPIGRYRRWAAQFLRTEPPPINNH